MQTQEPTLIDILNLVALANYLLRTDKPYSAEACLKLAHSMLNQRLKEQFP